MCYDMLYHGLMLGWLTINTLKGDGAAVVPVPGAEESFFKASFFDSFDWC